jgi:hypothetical protein
MQKVGFLYNKHLLLLLIIIAGVLLLSQAITLFFYDEDVFVTNLSGVFLQHDWQRSFFVKQFFKLESILFGKNPVGYHATSILLHLCNAWLAVKVLQQLLSTTQSGYSKEQHHIISVVFLLLFLFSPIHSEPLCYILAQGAIINACFTLLTIYFFIKTIKAGNFFLVPALVSFFIALLSYEISWLVPFSLLAISFVVSSNSNQSINKKLLSVAPFFIVLAVWLLIKFLFITKELVSDYGAIDDVSLLKLLRNATLLFVRNYVWPQENTSYFLVTAVAAIILLLVAVFITVKKNGLIIKLIVLFALLTIISYLPTAILGIDSHDSESERYVYLSSVFAIMLLAVVMVNSFKHKGSLLVGFGLLFSVNAVILFKTINEYKTAGKFTAQYLHIINNATAANDKVYIINQPSQHKGALQLRALSRLPQFTDTAATIVNEYMHFLFGNTKTQYITASLKETVKATGVLHTTVQPLEKAGTIFSEVTVLQTSPGSVIIALRNDTVYVFR